MPRIPLRLPPPGDCQIADQIRIRRHPRDLISLDGTISQFQHILLHLFIFSFLNLPNHNYIPCHLFSQSLIILNHAFQNLLYL